MKVCSKCKIEKDETCFSKRPDRKSGFSSHCKQCLNFESLRYSKEGRKYIVPPFDDLTGKHFNNLTVLEKTDRRSSTSILWKCLCDCGNITFVRGTSLKSGAIKSCGCLQSKLLSKPLDMTILYGRLSIIEKSSIRSPGDGSIQYRCLCECGNEILVPSCRLRSGSVKSCGCLLKENGILSQKRNIKLYRLSKGKDPNLSMSSATALLRSSLYLSGIKEKVKLRDGNKCVLCASVLSLQVHHIIPLSKNSDLNLNMDNLVTLCKICHVTKAHKDSWVNVDPDIQTELLLYIQKITETIGVGSKHGS
jgi:hypothetical protein